MVHRSTRRVRLAAATAAALGALAAAGPAQAQLPSVDEACKGTVGSEAFCIGMQKLAERASAECRRVGIPEEQCFTGSGRRVVGASIDAYRSSWVHRALEYQFALAHDVPFRDAPWIGTHNSFNSTSEAPTLSHTDSNQQLSLVDQLDIDMRSLEIDVHWFASPRAGPDAVETGGRAPVVCHGRPPDEMHAGCTSERLLSEVLVEINDWLNAHRKEVLLLYVEDALDDSTAYAKTAEVLEQGLRRPSAEGGRSLIYHPQAAADKCARLPLDLTRRKVLDAGSQVVLVSSCGNGWGGTVFDWDPVEKESRPHGFQGSPRCGPDFTRADYNNFLIRYFEDSTWIATTPAASTDDGITPQTAAAMTRCGVDLLSMDQILPEDGRLESLVWTWTAGDPPKAGECAVQRADSRWATRACAEKRPAACRGATGSWTLTAEPVAFADADARCADAGGRFDLPRTGHDNVRLRDAAGAAGEVWLNHGEVPIPEDPGVSNTDTGSAGGASGPAQAGGGSQADPQQSGQPGPPDRGGTRVRCRVARGRRVVVCRLRPAALTGWLSAARLSRHNRTFGRDLPGHRGGVVRLRSRRRLPRRAFAVTLTLGEGAAATRVRIRVPVR